MCSTDELTNWASSTVQLGGPALLFIAITIVKEYNIIKLLATRISNKFWYSFDFNQVWCNRVYFSHNIVYGLWQDVVYDEMTQVSIHAMVMVDQQWWVQMWWLGWPVLPTSDRASELDSKTALEMFCGLAVWRIVTEAMEKQQLQQIDIRQKNSRVKFLLSREKAHPVLCSSYDEIINNSRLQFRQDHCHETNDGDALSLPLGTDFITFLFFYPWQYGLWKITTVSGQYLWCPTAWVFEPVLNPNALTMGWYSEKMSKSHLILRSTWEVLFAERRGMKIFQPNRFVIASYGWPILEQFLGKCCPIVSCLDRSSELRHFFQGWLALKQHNMKPTNKLMQTSWFQTNSQFTCVYVWGDSNFWKYLFNYKYNIYT